MFHGYTDRPVHGLPHFILLLQLCHVYIALLHLHVMVTYHCYTCIHDLLILDIWITVHITCIIVSYYRIHVTWLFPVIDMDIPDTGLESCWYAICGLPHYWSRFPLYCSRFIDPVILFLIPVILFYAINRSQVLLSCYLYHVLLFVLVTLYTWHIR